VQVADRGVATAAGCRTATLRFIVGFGDDRHPTSSATATSIAASIRTADRDGGVSHDGDEAPPSRRAKVRSTRWHSRTMLLAKANRLLEVRAATSVTTRHPANFSMFFVASGPSNALIQGMGQLSILRPRHRQVIAVALTARGPPWETYRISVVVDRSTTRGYQNRSTYSV
jgi:hypothetical protein